MSELNLDSDHPESKAKILEILQRTHENNIIGSPAAFGDSDQEYNRFGFLSANHHIVCFYEQFFLVILI